MINLAGTGNRDREIRHELERNRIEVVTVDKMKCEVSTTLGGMLGRAQFRFVRAWTYWIVTGPFPSREAARMYETDPVWREDVRAGGHCGCPHPETQATGGIVDSFHVDSELGLRLLADCIRACGI